MITDTENTNYPYAPGFQRHSQTSREAAESCNAATLRGLVEGFIKSQGRHGATIDECARFMEQALNRRVDIGTASARVRELELRKAIHRTDEKRPTRAGRAAYVYLHGREPNKAPAVKKSAKTEPMTVESYRAMRAEKGHGHVVPRADRTVMRCGGPGLCRICQTERDYLNFLQQKEGGESHANH